MPRASPLITERAAGREQSKEDNAKRLACGAERGSRYRLNGSTRRMIYSREDIISPLGFFADYSLLFIM